MPPSLRNRTQGLDPDETDSEVELSFTGAGRAAAQRLQQQRQQQHQAEDLDSQDEDEEEEELEEEEDDLIDPSSPPNPNLPPLPNNDPPPSHLRDISTLASWTVSSSKPGCSVPQLRHPSTSLFWQSDGPQPHYLNIHFSKLVRVVALRLYLDFEIDESYTPTKILFLAGSGGNDLVEWGELKCESPRGWVWVDFSGVDDHSSDDDEGDEEDQPDAPAALANGPGTTQNRPADASSDSENNNPHPHQTPQHPPSTSATPSLPRPPSHPFQSPLPSNPATDPIHPVRPPAHARHPLTALDQSNYLLSIPSRRTRKPTMPVLRAHLIQVKILENHQNGKDTHLRGLQVFARNDEMEGGKVNGGRRGRGVGGNVGGGGGEAGRKKGRDRDSDEDLELGALEGEFGVR